MRTMRIGTYLSVVAAAACLFACNRKPGNYPFPTQTVEEARSRHSTYFTNMSDNALLHQMSLSEMHFVPNTTEISGTGAVRLDRLAALLKVYGGTVHYQTTSTNKEVIDQRLEHVREYLAAAGCDMDRVTVEASLGGGRGLAAADAIRILNEGTKNDLAEEGGGGTVTSLSGTTGGGQ